MVASVARSADGLRAVGQRFSRLRERSASRRSDTSLEVVHVVRRQTDREGRRLLSLAALKRRRGRPAAQIRVSSLPANTFPQTDLRGARRPVSRGESRRECRTRRYVGSRGDRGEPSSATVRIRYRSPIERGVRGNRRRVGAVDEPIPSVSPEVAAAVPPSPTRCRRTTGEVVPDPRWGTNPSHCRRDEWADPAMPIQLPDRPLGTYSTGRTRPTGLATSSCRRRVAVIVVASFPTLGRGRRVDPIPAWSCRDR